MVFAREAQLGGGQGPAEPTPATTETLASGRLTVVPTSTPRAAPTQSTVATAAPTTGPTATHAAVARTQVVATPRATPTGAAAAPPASPTAAPSATRAAISGPATVGSAGTIALTFDAGADRGYAEDILDVLADERVVASFGVTGVWARANPDLVRRMAGDGHLIINHTLDHRSFTGVSDNLGGLSAARRRAELDEADAILSPLIGHSTRPFYRLPYGDDDGRVVTDVASDGYSRKVGWTVDSLGWRGVAAADIVARCVRLAAPGGIYVFHVGRASQDGVALPQVIHSLRQHGYSFVRADAV